MSQTQPPAIPSPSKDFPAAWLVAKDDQLVIERHLWNNEPVPAELECDFSVNWQFASAAHLFKPTTSRGYAPGSTIIRLHFGLTGCIIPIAAVRVFDSPSMAFTFAGPTDDDGKKFFYMYLHDHLKISDAKLYRLGPFASVTDFYENNLVVPWYTVCVQPVTGGEEAAMEELTKHGYFSLIKEELTRQGYFLPERKSSKPKKGRGKRRG